MSFYIGYCDIYHCKKLHYTKRLIRGLTTKCPGLLHIVKIDSQYSIWKVEIFLRFSSILGLDN